MNKRATLLVMSFLCLFFPALLAQSTYSDYSYSDKTSFFREDFGSDTRNWETYVSGKRMGKVHDGVFDWVSMGDGAQIKWQTATDMNWYRDWQLEIRMKFVTGKENSSNDLFWNKKPGSSEKYHFGFTGQGKYVFSKRENSEYNQIVPFTASPSVNKNAFNKITVRKVRSRYYLFFNEKFITSHAYESITGDDFGFMVAPNSTIQIDYLDLSYLKSKSSTSNYNSTSSSTTSSGKSYTGVMTKNNGFSLQRWKTRDNFPKEDIKKDWDDDYYISHVSYDNSKWTIVTSKGTGFTNQRWRTRKEFPKPEINEMWDDGYSITDLTYGNGVWALVVSKGAGYTHQRWATSYSYPQNKIQEFRDAGYYITELTYGEDRWAVVGSKTSSIYGQRIFTSIEFPKDRIQTYWDMDYSITHLQYHQGQWVLIMSKLPGTRRQRWFTRKEFPKAKIKEYWGQDYYLTHMTYGGKAATTQTNYTPVSKSTTFSEPTNASEVRNLLTGTWYGGAKVSEYGYLKLSRNNEVMVIQKGDTVGGPNYQMAGLRLKLEYELNTFNKHLDFVFKNGNSVFGRMKGLYRFTDEKTLELIMNSELDGPRPSSWRGSGDIQKGVFKKRY